MRVLIFNHYTEGPEGQATRPLDIARRMVESGQDVAIFAASFNHYSFTETRLKGLQLSKREWVDGVELVWLRTFPYRSNDWRRVLNWLTYFILALTLGIFSRPSPDAVIGVSVHPLAALAASIVAWVRGSSFYFEVTDLWPQTLIEFGRISPNGLSAKLLRAIERYLCHRATRLLMLWRNTAEYLNTIGVNPDKIVWFPHGVEVDRYISLPPYDGRIHSPFVVMYLGGLVDANDIPTIVGAAAELERRGADVAFQLVGGGTHRLDWIERVQKMGLNNVTFPPPVPKAKIASVMQNADAFVYAVRDMPLYRYGISTNKVTDYLASGRPILFAGNSSYDPVAEARAGFSVPPEDAAGLADAIEQLMALSPEDRMQMGERGKRHLLTYHTIPGLANRLIDTLEERKTGRTLRSEVS